MISSLREGASSDDNSEVSFRAPRRGVASIFVDPEAMKDRVRQNLCKEHHDVTDYYKPEGIWRDIATSSTFGNITLLVISLNAIWIGIDTDYNKADILLEAEVPFQLAEHSFCFFFGLEWFARFMSFKFKINGLRDGWFVFDSILVFMMVLETWILTLVMLVTGSGSTGGLGNASILRMARLARLSRMARMARLLRVMPELMILIKGIATATRSVFFTLCLLCLLLYIFAIAFTQLTADTEVGDAYFSTVLSAMYSLLVCGTLMDNVGMLLQLLGDTSLTLGALFLLFVLLGTVTVMNMLIGVLCEVVSTVASVERETLAVTFVRGRMLQVFEALDNDGSQTISRDEFAKLLETKSAVEALYEVGVDVEGLVDFADFIFADEEDASKDKELTLAALMQVVMQFRGSNIATVKDIMELHKLIKQRIQETVDDMVELKNLIKSMSWLEGHGGVAAAAAAATSAAGRRKSLRAVGIDKCAKVREMGKGGVGAQALTWTQDGNATPRGEGGAGTKVNVSSCKSPVSVGNQN